MIHLTIDKMSDPQNRIMILRVVELLANDVAVLVEVEEEHGVLHVVAVVVARVANQTERRLK